MLHWIAEARARLVPVAPREGALLVDLGCGAGLLAPHVAGKGYRHIGVDLSLSALELAAAHGVTAIRGDVGHVPLPDEVADVVSAGEILEHVTDLSAALREACRILRPGGTLVLDTIAATRLAQLVVVTVAERLPGGAPPGLHDPALFVDRERLTRECHAHGVPIHLSGLRPSLTALVAWGARRRPAARMVPTWSTAVLFQGWGKKEVRVVHA